MRKRLVMGAVAVVVIGVAAYVLSQPREGSVEWHKREYFSSLERMYGQRFIDRARQSIFKRAGWRWLRPRQTLDERVKLEAKIEVHREALVRSEYIVERTFTVNNPMVFRKMASDLLATNRANRGGVWVTDTRPFLTCVIRSSQDGSVVVSGPRDDIGFFLERVVGKKDEAQQH